MAPKTKTLWLKRQPSYLQRMRDHHILTNMKSAQIIDDSINRTVSDKLVWNLAVDESGWITEFGGKTLVLRDSDANLVVVDGKRHVLVTKNSEAARLGDLLMETWPISTRPMPDDSRELGRALFQG